MTPTEITQLLSGGGVLALSVMVYIELRAIRPVLRSLERVTTALLERERGRTPRFGTPLNLPPLPDE